MSGLNAKVLGIGAGAIIALAVVIQLGFSPGGSPARLWACLEDTGVRYTPPPGWQLHDPFSSRSPYFLTYSYLTSYTSTDIAQALMLSEEEQSQIFLHRGTAAAINAQLKPGATVGELVTHPLVTVIDEGSATTADGRKIEYVVARMTEGLLAGDDVTYLIGSAEIGGDTFVVNAGGLTGSFDPEKTLQVIRSLHFDR